MAATDFITESQLDSLTTNVATAVKANTTNVTANATAISDHIGDTLDAHDASAISIVDAGAIYTATNVEEALQEVKQVADTAAGGGITLEQVQDDLGTGFIIGGTSLTKTYDDVANTLTLDVSGLIIGTDVQAHSSVLDATTASFLIADETKLDGIEALADVTDTASVTAAGAVMDSEVDANIKTLTLPATTTISAFGATLVDDIDAPAARTTLGLGTAALSAVGDFEPAGTVAALIDSAPATLDTLNEIAAALGDDPNFATTITTSLGLRVRVDAAQAFTGPQQVQGKANLGIATSVVNFASNFNTLIA